MTQPRTIPRAFLLVAAAAIAALTLLIGNGVFAQGGDEGEAFSGTLRFEGAPVAGVRIVAADAAGRTVGEAISGADGSWRIPLPGPGVWHATIDADTLPEGVTLRDPERTTLEVTVSEGCARPLIFQLGETEGEAFSGTLCFEDAPVAGVHIVAADTTGRTVGEAVSDTGGHWYIPLPGPGIWRATIDADTLPEGVTLRNPERPTLEVEVRAGRARPLIFNLGERMAMGPTIGERLAQAAFNGVKFGLIIAMCAIGLSLIFGLTGLINFAHGELVTLGAVAAWAFNAGTPGLPLLAAGAIAILIAGAAGGGVEFGLLRPLRGRRLGQFQFMVVTIGLSLLARHVMLLFFGPDRQRFTDFALQSEWTLGPFAVTPRDLTIMALSAAALAGVALFLQRARAGKAIRAVSDNPALAESSGIDVDRVILLVWMAGAALAAIGGVFFGSVEAIDYLMGWRLLLLMFAAVVLGGLGTAYGAMVGGLLIGVVTEVSTVWASPEIKAVFALGVLVLALLVRPQGLLGQRERVG